MPYYLVLDRHQNGLFIYPESNRRVCRNCFLGTWRRDAARLRAVRNQHRVWGFGSAHWCTTDSMLRGVLRYTPGFISTSLADMAALLQQGRCAVGKSPHRRMPARQFCALLPGCATKRGRLSPRKKASHGEIATSRPPQETRRVRHTQRG